MDAKEFLGLDCSVLNCDGDEIRSALEDGRCRVRNSDEENCINVFWYAAPNSNAPGGPWMTVNVIE